METKSKPKRKTQPDDGTSDLIELFSKAIDCHNQVSKTRSVMLIPIQSLMIYLEQKNMRVR
jgi:hypothetical protein